MKNNICMFSIIDYDDYVFIGGGESGVRAQSFLLTRKLNNQDNYTTTTVGNIKT